MPRISLIVRQNRDRALRSQIRGVRHRTAAKGQVAGSRTKGPQPQRLVREFDLAHRARTLRDAIGVVDGGRAGGGSPRGEGRGRASDGRGRASDELLSLEGHQLGIILPVVDVGKHDPKGHLFRGDEVRRAAGAPIAVVESWASWWLPQAQFADPYPQAANVRVTVCPGST